MVTPADGSHYVINYFGPRLVHLSLDNDTYRMPQPDWPDELWFFLMKCNGNFSRMIFENVYWNLKWLNT